MSERHVSNFLQTNDQILLDLINHDNGTELPLTAITFGTPVAQEGDETGLITNVTASATVGSGYSGSQDFVYNRVPLSFMNDNEPDFVIETDVSSIHELIPMLNSTFGIQLTEADIVDGVVEEQEPDVMKEITIQAAQDSLVWTGQVTLAITLPLIPLNTVLTVTALDGLYPPAPVVEPEEDVEEVPGGL